MKNIDNIILKTSKDLGVPKEKVKIVIDAYWDEVYRKLLTLESTTLFIRNVGMITISKYKLKRFIVRYIDKIRVMKKNDKYSEADKDKIITFWKNKLGKALKHRDLIAKDYAEKFGNI